METWPKMDRIRYMTSTFFTQDLSQDDPYLLYAALKSGPKANFCSRDLMRSHAFLLGDELKPIFQKWRQSHQYQLITARHLLNPIIKNPSQYKRSAHQVNNVWHIPFVEEEASKLDTELQEEFKWVCLPL